MTQSQLIKQCQRRLCLQFGGGFPLNGSQQHRQQAAHNAPFAIAKKCILPFSVTVYPSQTRFSHPAISLACAFNSSGKAGSCFPSMINWRYLSSHCDNGAKVLRNVSAVTVVPNGCPANCGFVINPPIIPARGQRHSPAHPHHSLYYMAQMRRAVCRYA